MLEKKYVLSRCPIREQIFLDIYVRTLDLP